MFTSLYHHVTDIDNLRECYLALDKDKASGIDRVSKAGYGRNLETNLADLSERLKRMGYKPKPKRRTYIEKPGSSKKRPLGISAFEDKIVELAVKRTIEPLFETLFEDCSYGYRPGSSQHQCVDALGRTIQQQHVNHVVEADIRGYFDHVSHYWLEKFLRQRIGDERIIRLITRMLKAGIMEDGLVTAGEFGTPQGSILSPLLSNVYLHYVLDLWFQRRIRKSCRGEAYLVRFADDFLACFQYQEEAEDFTGKLAERFKGFNLQLAEEKTQCIPFGRFARENAYRKHTKPKEFDFLGFTFYSGKNRYGGFKVKRKTARKKLQQALAKFSNWLRRRRGLLPTGELVKRAIARFNGHLNYYAITDNLKKCNLYRHLFRRILFKWLNRRSQRKSYNWKGFEEMLRRAGMPQVKTRHGLNPFNLIPNV
ncbi:MAG: group II intron reverse transcriptase/maturase [Victivallaceae bacterium]|nr:group II intron reverse transcriptase/maturase [Victivallaceae bacterium]